VFSEVFDMLFVILLFAVMVPLGIPRVVEMYNRQSKLIAELEEDKNTQSFSGFGVAKDISFDNTFNVFDTALITIMQDSNNPPRPDLVYVTGDPDKASYSFRVNNDYTDKLPQIGTYTWNSIFGDYSMYVGSDTDYIDSIPRCGIQHGFNGSLNFWKIVRDDSNTGTGSVIDENVLP